MERKYRHIVPINNSSWNISTVNKVRPCLTWHIAKLHVYSIVEESTKNITDPKIWYLTVHFRTCQFNSREISIFHFLKRIWLHKWFSEYQISLSSCYLPLEWLQNRGRQCIRIPRQQASSEEIGVSQEELPKCRPHLVKIVSLVAMRKTCSGFSCVEKKANRAPFFNLHNRIKYLISS